MTANVLNIKIGEVENKIPGTCSFVKKTGYKAKTSDIENKYFATYNYNKFTKYLKQNA